VANDGIVASDYAVSTPPDIGVIDHVTIWRATQQCETAGISAVADLDI